ncbi:non-hydrolyzing UDP-N-acetylglucosamine 2-epimerase [Aurantiacibacter rhizosphaerae]|uniref:UDP-N-acetylglucosamine 2-epimerase (non-hydrolyzing) n=1 Tax=Aurantiacibacter rhizosphaerae TaxID=2691582 RepID=A0A844X9V5_9SPHN|nr:UDP-N-acetylglucosamine 2-epimerase (non-hydrolyzing) [Aurantiacibacter rhizosphaerae]MWV26532.1 UDP-N-acetylglucosamine 2-epimerase (non-hydrolyzing) [Aurantiacibacter rhizosphaerae]
MSKTDTALPRILVCFGTRPEAIKMFPVVHALRAHGGMDVRVAVTAQHREILDQVLEIGGIVPDIDLDLMRPNQSLDELSARILTKFGAALDEWKPDRVLVHGDTLTTMMVTLSSYFRKIPVGHVEAGLRSGNIYSPWPEEVNRKVAGAVSDLHFAPTDGAAAALRAENVPQSAIHVTGNTVIDALFATRDKVAAQPALAAGLDDVAQRFAGKRIIALTAHRRENFGQGMQDIAQAIADLADRPDVAVIFPVHPNPNVRPVMEAALGGRGNVALIEPLDYPHFVRLMEMADLLLTDSGGVQEEGPSFGKPVLVMRDTTERPEGIAAGTAKLVGTDRGLIVSEATRLLDNRQAYKAMAQAHNPYGDGKASQRIASVVAAAHGAQRQS